MTSKVFTTGTTIDSAWLNDVNNVVYAAIGPSAHTDVYTATASQTVFTLSATPVLSPKAYLNGLRLTPTTDYSVTGTTLTLVAGATLADELLVDY